MDQDEQRTRTTFGIGDDTLRRDVAARIERIIGAPQADAVDVPSMPIPVREADPDAIDVATYLLDPPASADDVARTERRARTVRIGSLVGCAVLGVILLVPMPDRGSSSAAPIVEQPVAEATAAPSATDEASVATPSAATASPATPTLPRRIDAPAPTKPAARRIDARARGTSARTTSGARGAATTNAAPASVAGVSRAPRPVARPAATTSPKPAAAPVAKPAATSTPAPTGAPKPAATEASSASGEAVLVPLG